MADPYVTSVVYGAAAELGTAAVLGAGAAIGAGELVYKTGKYILGKRKRTASKMNMVVDDIPIAAGGITSVSRNTVKRKLKSGRIGRKLQKENLEFIQRFQRVYQIGVNTNAYPVAPANEQGNVGTTIATWTAGKATVAAGNPGRLLLSHVTGITVGGDNQWQLMPGYLFDITCWRHNLGDALSGYPFRRIGFDGQGRARLIQVPNQNNDNTYTMNSVDWIPEQGYTGSRLPESPEQKAVLAWTDARFLFHGSTDACYKISMELVQFKDEKYLLDFHPDGESPPNQTALDQNDVNAFWNNEFKRGIFNPMVVNTFNRKQALTVLSHEDFCINANSNDSRETAPGAVHRQLFKRFNRLCRWDWNKPTLTYAPTATNLEGPTYQTTSDGGLRGYCDPKARIFIYIKAEAYSGQVHDQAIATAYGRECSFDMIVRNKWLVQN